MSDLTWHQSAEVLSWVSGTDSFEHPAKEMARLRALNRETYQVVENMRAIQALVNEANVDIAAARQHVAQADANVASALGLAGSAAKAHVKLLPMKAAGVCAMIGGGAGAVVGLLPGAVLGAAVGTALGAMAGAISKDRTERKVDEVVPKEAQKALPKLSEFLGEDVDSSEKSSQ